MKSLRCWILGHRWTDRHLFLNPKCIRCGRINWGKI